MSDVCIIGSGVAGSSIAKLLSRKFDVHVFDKARGPGGRASNKRFNKSYGFDHGVQYISPKSYEFKKFVNKLHKKKILKLWKGNHLDFSFEKKHPDAKYIGKKANNEICKYQLNGIKKSFFSQVTKIEYVKNNWEITVNKKSKFYFKRLIITCPYPQSKKLSRKYLSKKLLNLNINMKPNLTLMLAIKQMKPLPVSSIKFNDDILAWAAYENSKKRFKSKIHLWTIQACLDWSIKKINKYKKDKSIINQMVSRFTQLTGVKNKQIIFKKIHGWKYSYNFNQTNIDSFWSNKYQLGICGDWFLGPKVEHAWISAVSLFKKINKKT